MDQNTLSVVSMTLKSSQDRILDVIHAKELGK